MRYKVALDLLLCLDESATDITHFNTLCMLVGDAEVRDKAEYHRGLAQQQFAHVLVRLKEEVARIVEPAV